MKKSTLTAGLKAVMDQTVATKDKARAKTILIGGHFSPEVRRALLLVQAEQENIGKNLKQLLGEAINDLCAKYGKPEPYDSSP